MYCVAVTRTLGAERLAQADAVHPGGLDRPDTRLRVLERDAVGGSTPSSSATRR